MSLSITFLVKYSNKEYFNKSWKAQTMLRVFALIPLKGNFRSYPGITPKVSVNLYLR